MSRGVWPSRFRLPPPLYANARPAPTHPCDLADPSVTLEYATSATFLSHTDPFGPFAPSYAIGVRLPAALDAFGKHPQHRSANLFDLLDAMGLGFGLGAPRQWTPPT